MIKPMLCESTKKEEIDNFGSNWKSNIKYDGERIIAVVEGNAVILYNRRGRIKNTFYGEVVDDLKKINGEFVLDGEIISVDDDFNKLQRRALTSNAVKQEQLRKEIPVTFMVFDILKFNGEDLTSMPLKDRITYLNALQYENLKHIGFVSYEDDLKGLMESAESNNCEGIIIKNMFSKYQIGKRSSEWLKLKFFKQTDLRITNYTINNAGIRCEDKNGIAVQVAGNQSKAVKDDIDKLGYSEIIVQYLEKTKENKLRFPSFIKRKNG